MLLISLGACSVGEASAAGSEEKLGNGLGVIGAVGLIAESAAPQVLLLGKPGIALGTGYTRSDTAGFPSCGVADDLVDIRRNVETASA